VDERGIPERLAAGPQNPRVLDPEKAPPIWSMLVWKLGSWFSVFGSE
jgi:hypothetical protein